MNLDLILTENLSRYDSSKVIISKTNNYSSAVILRTNEIQSLNDGGLIIWTLNWSEVRFNCSNDWSIIIQITILFLVWDDSLPVLLIQG